jgi:tRNA threonylcarbamoyladenosine modification (KEOPS) complex Cgi121 subunit
MLNFYSLKTHLKNEQIISAIKDYKAIAIRPEIGVLEEFISSCFERAKEDFTYKRNVAEKFQIQWLCRIACTRNIKKAIGFCEKKTNAITIISENEISFDILKSIGEEYKFELNQNAKEKLLKEYSIPKISLAKYEFQALLEEKSLISYLE